MELDRSKEEWVLTGNRTKWAHKTKQAEIPKIPKISIGASPVQALAYLCKLSYLLVFILNKC